MLRETYRIAAKFWQMIGEPLAGENAASGRLQQTLEPLKDQHVIGFASWLIDPSHHCGLEHPADCLRVFVADNAEIDREPSAKAVSSIPSKIVQISPDRMERLAAGV